MLWRPPIINQRGDAGLSTPQRKRHPSDWGDAGYNVRQDMSSLPWGTSKTYPPQSGCCGLTGGMGGIGISMGRHLPSLTSTVYDRPSRS